MKITISFLVLLISGYIFADTFSVKWLDSDAGRYFYGMDDSGHVVFTRSGTTLCSVAGDDCYETFLNGSLVGYSSTVPAFNWDYTKGFCGYLKFYPCAISDNGRSVDIANPYAVEYGANQVLHGNGFGGIFAIKRERKAA